MLFTRNVTCNEQHARVELPRARLSSASAKYSRLIHFLTGCRNTRKVNLTHTAERGQKRKLLRYFIFRDLILSTLKSGIFP